MLDENVKSRELTSDEVKLVIEQYGVGDCGGREDALAKVHISIGDVNKVSLTKIRVWTNGRDGISETGDDNIIPWEENLHP